MVNNMKLKAVVDVRCYLLHKGKYADADTDIELQYVQSVQYDTVAGAYLHRQDRSTRQVPNGGDADMPNENGSASGRPNMRCFSREEPPSAVPEKIE